MGLFGGTSYEKLYHTRLLAIPYTLPGYIFTNLGKIFFLFFESWFAFPSPEPSKTVALGVKRLLRSLKKAKALEKAGGLGSAIF